MGKKVCVLSHLKNQVEKEANQIQAGFCVLMELSRNYQGKPGGKPAVFCSTFQVKTSESRQKKRHRLKNSQGSPGGLLFQAVRSVCADCFERKKQRQNNAYSGWLRIARGIAPLHKRHVTYRIIYLYNYYTHRIHIWYIYLHLGHLWGKCW